MAINDPSSDLAAVYNALHSDAGFPAADRILAGIKKRVWDEGRASAQEDWDFDGFDDRPNPYHEAKEKR